MRKTFGLLALLLVGAVAPVHAVEPVEDREPSAELVPQVATVEAEAPSATEMMELEKVQVSEYTNADEALAAQPARGSFWWVVGVIVVAGVILAVVL